MPPHTVLDFVKPRLRTLYPQRHAEAHEMLLGILQKRGLDVIETPEDPHSRWNEQDVVLITYGDQVQSEGKSPLQSLRQFLADHDLFTKLNTVHFLPCFPYSSDDGFSVIDYRQIDPALGTWDDMTPFRTQSRLMLDFVVNHISQESDWFQGYLQGDAKFANFFIEVDPEADVSMVTRPRSLPLLSEFETSRGKRSLWTTFSRDQVDLNYSEPAVLAEVIDVLLEYVDRGARIIRLDAIAYLWKQLGTPCIHLTQTHEVVKLIRSIIEIVSPDVLILTETNVPHEENISYFGDGDEAHMVYQFSLPPLLLDAYLNDDAAPLKRWFSQLESPPPGTTYFNFTASHDGVGVRPLEGHVSDNRLLSLVQKIKDRGGLVGTRRQPDGTDSPYELNISYVSALATNDGDPAQHAQRFLSSQAIMLAMQGVPAVYFHSLTGTQNDLAGVEASGIPRRINRRKFELDELNQQLTAHPLSSAIFTGLKRLIAVRVEQPAFHPNAAQRYWESGLENVLMFERAADSGQRILIAVNFGDTRSTLDLPIDFEGSTDLLNPGISLTSNFRLEPAQVVWLEAKGHRA